MRASTALLLVACACLWSASAKADRETEAWLSAGVTYEPHERIRLSLAPQFRIREASPHAARFLVDGGGRFRVKRWLYFGVGYRFTLNQTDGDSAEWQVLNRVHGDARLRFRFGRVQLRSRTRFQTRVRPDEDGRRIRHTLRQRFTLRIRAPKRFRPFLSAETFVRVRDRDGTEFWKQRFTIGVGYGFRDHGFSIGYRLEVPLASRNDTTSHIILVGYTFEIDPDDNDD